jgi:LmbE family N-acetylglucosaminyl deacetylase
VVAVLTDGAASHPNLDAPARTQLRRQRQQEVRQAVACLGLPASNLELLGLPDGALAQAAGPCVAVLTHLARTRGCNIIVVTSPHDQHPDHQAAALIAREVAASACIPCVSYPTWAWVVAPDTDFPVEAIRGWRLDITRYLPAKRRAIVAHSSQYFGLPDDPWQACLPAELLAIAQRPYEVILTS